MFDMMRSSRGVASVAVMALVGGLSAVGLMGTGLSGSVLGALPGSAWLGSSEKGDVVLANGANGAGVARAAVPGAKGAKMSVVHRGGFACVRSERPDGEITVNCVDDATFGDAGSTKVKKSQTVVRTGDHAYMVEAAKGLVRPLDPKSLAPEGDALEFRAPISTVADDDGRLLVLELEVSVASVVVGSATVGDPVTIGESRGNLYGSLVDGQFAVVAQADAQVTLFVDGKVGRRVGLPGELGSLLVPGEVEGGELPLLSQANGRVEVMVLDTTSDKGRRVRVKKELPKSSEVFATSAGLFVPDRSSGLVVRVDTSSGDVESIDVNLGKGKGNLEVFTKDGKLWVNNPSGSKAVVIDGRGERHEVNKYDEEIEEVDPGWQAEPAQVATPEPPPLNKSETSELPPPNKSEAPEGPVAPIPPTPNTSEPDPTQVTTAPTPIPVPVDDGTSTQTEIPTPTNGPGTSIGGEAEVPAERNDPATQPRATAPPTTTTRPAVPASGQPPQLSPLTATAKSRSVTLRWSTVGEIESYDLTCRPSCRPPFVAAGDLDVEIGGLDNGTSYSFVLVAKNEQGASRPAQVGAVPMALSVPSPRNVTATVDPTGSGSVRLDWTSSEGSGVRAEGFEITCHGPSGGQVVDPYRVQASGATSESVELYSLNGPPANWEFDDDDQPDTSCQVVALASDGGAPIRSEPVSSNHFDPWKFVDSPILAAGRSDESARGVEITTYQSWEGRPGYVRVKVGDKPEIKLKSGTSQHIAVGAWGTTQVSGKACVGDVCVDEDPVPVPIEKPTMTTPTFRVTKANFTCDCGTTQAGDNWVYETTIDLKGMNPKFVTTYRELHLPPYPGSQTHTGAWTDPKPVVGGPTRIEYNWHPGAKREYTLEEVKLMFEGLPGEDLYVKSLPLTEPNYPR